MWNLRNRLAFAALMIGSEPACTVESTATEDFTTPEFVVGADGTVTLSPSVVRLAQEEGCATEQIPKWVDGVGWTCSEDNAGSRWQPGARPEDLVVSNSRVGIGTLSPAAWLELDASGLESMVRNNSELVRFGDVGHLGLTSGRPLFSVNAIGLGDFARGFATSSGIPDLPMALLSLVRTPGAVDAGGLYLHRGSPTAGTEVAFSSFTPVLTWTVSGNVGFGTNEPQSALHAVRAEAVIALRSTGLTAQNRPNLPPNSAGVFERDGELYTFDDQGNTTLQSPHNARGEWVFYSHNRKTGRTVHVNMERMVRRLESLTGETFFETGIDSPSPPSSGPAPSIKELAHANRALKNRVKELEVLVERRLRRIETTCLPD